jgi:sterol desaturase/sphingolipid hydroxylase (fatty acid hydroxylase superfamily)
MARSAVRTAVLIGGIAALLWLERRHPLRVPVDPGLRRIARNVAVGVLTAATVTAIERPIVTRVAAMAERRGWGLVPRLGAPPAIASAVGVALMDYTLYWWHVLLHRIPALWRMHEPHHIDRDLDTSTALRFHFAEFLASVPWRCAQVVVIGAGPRLLALWQKLTLAEVLFHHSNLRLPRAIERLASLFVVTPRLHGIHHSVERRERDSNFSSGLTVWDRVHGTAHFDLARDDVEIGLPGFERADDVTLERTLALPFEHREAQLAQNRQAHNRVY